MHSNIDELNRFYQSKLGKLVANCVEQKINSAFANFDDLNILSFGFASPFINKINQSTNRLANFIPYEIGIQRWPQSGANKTIIGNENNMPFADSCFDRAICIHGIEGAQNPKKLLREFWRIIKDDAEVTFVITNRRSAWAQFDTSPFGHSRPYSKSQISRLLDDSMFEIVEIDRILTFPPFSIGLSKKYAAIWEKVGKKLWPAIGGLLVIRAKKRLFGGVLVGSTKQRTKLKPAQANFLNKKHE